MFKASRPLLLWCDAVNSKFTLAEDGGDWRRSFDSFEEAYEEAERRATDEIPLIIYNERGEVMVELTVSPLSTELVNRHLPLPVKTAFADSFRPPSELNSW